MYISFAITFFFTFFACFTQVLLPLPSMVYIWCRERNCFYALKSRNWHVCGLLLYV